MIPIDSNEFTSLKRIGIVSEIAVCECVHLNKLLRSQLYAAHDADQCICTTHCALNAPYDIELWTFKTGIYAGMMSTIEVKSAQNGGRYPTFFAEIYQTASRSYAEYIVHPPAYMVYVDTESNTHYWYNGSVFVNAVKSHWDERIPNKRGTAMGVRFGTRSDVYGFLWLHVAAQLPSETYMQHKDAIEHRIETTADKITNTYRICEGLPDLNDVNVI